ncbi:MAG: hypothetical protein ACQESP_12675 [Candidatus Muiribacteriota bacterium]
MKKNKILDLFNQYKYVLYFPLAIFLIFIFKDINKSIVFSTPYILINSIIFILAFIIFLVIGSIKLYQIFKNLLKNRYNLKTILYTSFVTLFSLIFLISQNNLTGRFNILHFIMGNIFDSKVLNATLLCQPRTYAPLLFSVFSQLGIKITPITILYFNKIFGFGLLLVVFFAIRKLFKSNFIGFIGLILFILSDDVKHNLASIEPKIIAVFFIYLSIITMINYVNTKDKLTLFISCSSVLLASFFRYEFSLFLGLPFLVYYSLFIKKVGGKHRKYILSTLVILIIILMSFTAHFTHVQGDDKALLGSKFTEKTPHTLLINGFDTFKENIFIENNLTMENITILTIMAFYVSIFMVIKLMSHIFRRSENSIRDKPFYINALFFLIVLFSYLFFNVEGLSLPHKSHFVFYLSEIILSFFLIKFFATKYKNLRIRKYFFYLILLILCFISLLSSPLLNTKELKYNSRGALESKYLLDNFEYKDECFILKNSVENPKLDFLIGEQDKIVYLWDLPRIDIKGKCFYYYHEFDISEEVMKYSNKEIIALENIESYFGGCKEEVILQKSYSYKNTSILRYDC